MVCTLIILSNRATQDLTSYTIDMVASTQVYRHNKKVSFLMNLWLSMYFFSWAVYVITIVT